VCAGGDERRCGEFDSATFEKMRERLEVGNDSHASEPFSAR
jgi:hypothetical protein